MLEPKPKEPGDGDGLKEDPKGKPGEKPEGKPGEKEEWTKEK